MKLSILTFGFAFLFLSSMPSPSFAQTKNPYNTSQLEKADPTQIASQQLHKNYTDPQHRYRLTVEGNNLEDNPTIKKRLNYSWSTNCGRFYEGGEGPSSRYFSNSNKSVVWGYEYPKEDCTEALIRVIVRQFKGGERVREVYISQKIFYPEEKPEIKSVDSEVDLKKLEAEKKAHPIQSFLRSLYLRIAPYIAPYEKPRDLSPGGVRG